MKRLTSTSLLSGHEVSYTAPDADGGTIPPTVVAYLEGATVTVSLDEPTRDWIYV